MQRLVKKINLDWGLFLVLILSFFSVFSLFHSGFPPSHDGEYHIVRFYEFDKTLKSGSWYPLWAPDLNYAYGSPLFNYVYPLPNYVASFFHLFGLSFIDSFKLNFIVASLVGSVSMYYLVKNRFEMWGGVLASAFYTYAPYHFLDIYIRGSVGEVWALAFFPLCFLFLDKLAKKVSPLSIILFGISYSLVIFSHNILAAMFSFFAGSYSLMLIFKSKRKRRTFFHVAMGFMVGLLLSSVFIIPALLEQKYVVGLQVFSPVNNFPELFQLLIPSWGSGFSGGSIADEMSFQIGIMNLIVIFLVLFRFFLKKIKKTELLYIPFFMVWFFVLVFLISPFSSKIWETITLMNYFQFSWRFLSLVIFCTAILAGGLVHIFKSKTLYVVLFAGLVVSTYQYAHPPYFFDRQDSYYTTKPNFIFGTNSVGNIFQTRWLSQQSSLPKFPMEISGAKIISKNAVKQVYLVDLNEKKDVVFNTAYFPGWKAYVDGKSAHIINKSGKMLVHVPRGSHTVILQLEDTFVRFIAKSISILTFFVILCILTTFAVIQLLYGHRHR